MGSHRLHPVLAGIVQIEVHLAGVRVAEPADLEVDDQQAAQPAVKEQQINAEPGVIQTQPALATDEGKIVAQLRQKVGQMLDQCRFEVGFRVLVPEVEEFQNERIFDRLLGADGVAG